MPPARNLTLTKCMRNSLRKAVRGAGIVVLGFVPWIAVPADAATGESPAYVGSEACKVCHEEIYNNLKKTPHSEIDAGARRGWEQKACESCHGPGGKHVESASADDIKNPSKQTSEAVDRTCLTCHLNQRTPGGRIASGHARDQVACTTCHSIHGAGGATLVTRNKAEINAKCSTCHLSQWASFNKPYKHRLPENAMSCVDCHNPHASLRPDTFTASFGNEPGCLSCHSDKRGPFVYEHAPMRLEGCTACHEPHGSANPRMLVRHVQRLVCLECHSNLPVATNTTIGGVPPAFHDLRSTRFQECTTCHVKVHGSYVDRMFLR